MSSSQLSREGEIEKTDFLIVVFTPWELNGLSYQERIAYVRKATERAVELGADLVCDTSAADRARLSEKDHASTKLLKRAGIARAVVFDGGHHLPNLALDPELLLCPVIGGTDRQELIAHGFCRDALPVEKLIEIRELIGHNSASNTFPRFAGYLKSPQTLGTLCLEAARLLAAFNQMPAENPTTRNLGAKVLLLPTVFCFGGHCQSSLWISRRTSRTHPRPQGEKGLSRRRR